MRTQSPDTSPSAERVQVALLKRASVAARSERMRSLTRSTVQLALRALGRQHPEWSREELFVAFVALHYGAELADGLRGDLARRGGLP